MMANLKSDMAILATGIGWIGPCVLQCGSRISTSGRWVGETHQRRVGEDQEARSSRVHGRPLEAGRAATEITVLVIEPVVVPPLRRPADRANRRRERREAPLRG